MQIDFSPAEIDFLSSLLESQQGKMLWEIRRTDTREYRTDLKRDEELLEGLLRKLKDARSRAA
jgi:hypothetical protein